MLKQPILTQCSSSQKKIIEEKIIAGENGTQIIIGKEIYKIMQLAIVEEADEEVQISILCLLNKMNLGINNQWKKESI